MLKNNFFFKTFCSSKTVFHYNIKKTVLQHKLSLYEKKDTLNRLFQGASPLII